MLAYSKRLDDGNAPVFLRDHFLQHGRKPLVYTRYTVSYARFGRCLHIVVSNGLQFLIVPQSNNRVCILYVQPCKG